MNYYEEYLSKVERKNVFYSEALSLVILDKDTAKFAIDEMFERLKSGKEDRSILVELKKIITKWGLKQYAIAKAKAVKLRNVLKELI